MNTRLQVEHAVTEAVVGVDLVHAQLLVASGEPLPWRDGSLTQRGHAIEARVYAEDPAHDFLPQAGPLLIYREPRLPGVRVDGGVVEGGEVSIHYDPMLAKIIASGENRDLAIARLVAALRDYPILGVRTNIPFLIKVLEHPRFRAGDIDTGFLDREGPSLSAETGGKLPAFLSDALAQIDDGVGAKPEAESPEPRANADPWVRLQGWRA
jgi:acetyl/propionyl-CoA carboxylase alpha subunit